MNCINKEFKLQKQQLKKFKREGFLKLENLFSNEIVDYFNIAKPETNYGSNFSINYDLSNNNENRALKLEYPKKEFNYGTSSDFNINLKIDDNAFIIKSPLLKNNLNRRYINGN